MSKILSNVASSGATCSCTGEKIVNDRDEKICFEACAPFFSDI